MNEITKMPLKCLGKADQIFETQKSKKSYPFITIQILNFKGVPFIRCQAQPNYGMTNGQLLNNRALGFFLTLDQGAQRPWKISANLK